MPPTKKAAATKTVAKSTKATKKITKHTAVSADRALGAFEERMTKLFGAGSFDPIPVTAEGNYIYNVISTGSVALDDATGVGGLVVGRIYEDWGPPSIGKSTMLAIWIAECQKKFPERYAAWIDVEHRVDLPWLARHGVDLRRLRPFYPDSAEDVADAVKEITRVGLFSGVVLDSVGAMIPEKEFDKEAGEVTVAGAAKVITRMVKMAAVECQKTDTTLRIINQIRANIGYGGDIDTPGGHALKHATTMKFKYRRTGEKLSVRRQSGGRGDNKSDEVEVGHEIAIKVERNSVAPPNHVAKIMLVHEPTPEHGMFVGVDVVDEIVNIGILRGVIKQAGGWFTPPGFEKGLQGRPAVIKALIEDPLLAERIRTEIMAKGSAYEHEVDLESPEADGTPDTGDPALQGSGIFRTSGEIAAE